MSFDIIQHASIAGELAKNLWGRTDFEKYDSAWAKAQNWTVDYRGGLFSRAGFEFGDIIQWSAGQKVKFIEFQFSPDTANTYIVVLTHLKARFIQDNAYVLESAQNITAVSNGTGNRITLAVNAHGYANGDWVKLSGFTHASLLFLNNRTVQVANQTANDFSIQDAATGADLTTIISTNTGSVARIYTITSPFSQADFARLQGKQLRDFVRFTHPSYPIYNLVRTAATNWSISLETIGSSVDAVTGLAAAIESGADENDCHVWMVSAVDENGEEGPPDIVLMRDGPNITTEYNRAIRLSWTAVTGAVLYKVYRSRAVNSADGSGLLSDFTVGFIGECVGTAFTDAGITPDFTKQPMLEHNPFANGRIRYVTVGAGGTGAQYDSAITWPSGGSGAYGFLICEFLAAGNDIKGVKVLNGGKDYTGTSVTVAAAAGETLTAVLSAASGNNPHCLALFQQRMLYGATDTYPLRIFGSRPGLLSNFNVSDISSDGDAYEFDLDAEKVAPIRHLLPIRTGLLVFNQLGVWLLSGRNGNALTANNAQADPQNSEGASYVQPLSVDVNIVFVSSTGQEIQQLAYTDNSRVFENQNVSLLSNHLFDHENEIVALAWTQLPSKVLYAVQENGRLLSLTLDAANGVYGCTPNWTKGFFREAVSILEDNASRLYVAVERTINGTKVLYFERQFAHEKPRVLEDAFCVDSGLRLATTSPSGTLEPSSFTGAVTFDVTGATPFVVGDVGKIIRCGDGKATITGYTDSNTVTGTWTRALTDHEPEEESTPKKFASGEWTMDSATTSIKGLWHLEGRSVTGMADGVVFTKTVSGAAITLDSAASRVSLGLGYKCIAQTLPPTVSDTPIEGRRKDNVGLAVRLFQTASLKIGSTYTDLYSVADRATKLGWASGVPRLRDEMIYEATKGTWGRDEQLWFVQDQPQPAAILSFVRDMDLGDGKGDVRGDDV